MTLICASIFVEDVAPAMEVAEQARRAGADMIEWRVDHVADHHKLIEALVKNAPLPCIVTCRIAREGGEYEGDEMDRISMFEHVGLFARPRYIDVELAAFERSANLRQKVRLAIRHPDQFREMDTGLILSTHDFQGRPHDLLQRFERMNHEESCEVVKIVWTARSIRDNLEAFELLQHRHKPTIAICMGRFGLMSRVLAPKFGGFLTFASTHDTTATAPGQPTVEELRNLYHFDRINPDTAVYGVIGWPVAHSKSPQVHNAAFQAAGHNGVYLPLPVPSDEIAFKATLGALIDDPHLTFRGASVTSPHKTHLINFVRDRGGTVDEAARRCGAANTLIVHQEDHSLEARNSDGPALVDSIVHALTLPDPCDLAGLRIAILGAGGMARAAVAELSRYGASIVIYNRTLERGQILADAFKDCPTLHETSAVVSAAPIEAILDSSCDIIINCTPVGMEGGPAPDDLPFSLPEMGGNAQDKAFGWMPKSGDLLVVDTVYAPVETPLIRFARDEAGARVLTGQDLFLRQAQMQSAWWTGRNPPPEMTDFDRWFHSRMA